MFGPAVFRPEPAASGGGDDDPVDYERAGFLDEVQGKAGSPVGGVCSGPIAGSSPAAASAAVASPRAAACIRRKGLR
ncbi:hypothetical protein Pflav_009790 [Phytohabitans flavus]|uniref:Uncharacterized protein n=1 Tax=Phytohabitans flavus TaxID=1076124 RepID=A0A6F8XLA6_9ACTN|nr:hypothetical protein Pflav_009790 [Phytohabitans flavus]